MKKKVLITILFIAIINSLSAQLAIGPKIGLNISKEVSGVEPIDESVNFKKGLNIGVFGKYKFNGKLGIQTELLYSQQGLRNNVSVSDVEGMIIADNYNILSHYLNVPVLLKYYPFKYFYIEAGPQFGYCFEAKISSDDYLSDGNISFGYNKVDSYLVGGIGVDIGCGLSINARYNHGFNHTLLSSKWKNRVIQLSLSYNLF